MVYNYMCSLFPEYGFSITFSTIERCIHGPVLVHTLVHTRGGSIENVVLINESTWGS